MQAHSSIFSVRRLRPTVVQSATMSDIHQSNNETIQLRLREGAHRLGIDLSAAQVDLFESFYAELVKWNKRLNLTAITEYEEVQIKHFLDCITLIPLLTEESGEQFVAQEISVIDVGTGAGFPGIPLKILCPNLNLTLLDGTGKKLRFLEQVLDKLGLENVYSVQGRAEELGRIQQYREQYDIATARAVAPLNTLAEYLLPLVRVGGLAAIYKGASAAEEFVEAQRAISILGGETVRMVPVEVPFLDAKRFILLIEKVRPTIKRYPRAQGLARKQPLT